MTSGSSRSSGRSATPSAGRTSAALAARAGWRVTAAELERAHALDWGMRWARYHGPERP